MNTRITQCSGKEFEYFENEFVGLHSIAIGKAWEPHMTSFVKLYHDIFLIRNMIDVGANFGYHTVLFSDYVQNKVFAFEPQVQNFDLLKKNIERNGLTNVQIYNFACGDVQCDVKMPLIDECIHNTNMGDITPNIYNDKFTITQSVLLDEMEFASLPIDCIKIDVQGWEKKVLLGSVNILQTHKPVLIVEFECFQLSKTNTSCEELFQFIRNQDYYIYFLEYSYPSDHVCVHRDHLENFRTKFQHYICPHTMNNNINNNVHYGVTEKIVQKNVVSLNI